MACPIDLFHNPDQLDDASALIQNLKDQVTLVQAFDFVYERLQNSVHLHSNVLGRCLGFAKQLEGPEASENFLPEVKKLNLNEFMFASVCFGHNLLPKILGIFKAHKVRAYILARNIDCTKRSEIRSRHNNYLKAGEGKIFKEILSGLRHEAQPVIVLRPPIYRSPGDFDLRTALWDRIADTFGAQAADQLPHVQNIYEAVSTRIHRTQGDAVILFDPRTSAWPGQVFREVGGGVPLKDVPFKSGLMQAIDESDLRTWERTMGFQETTSCVRVVPFVEVRISRTSPVMSFLHAVEEPSESD